MDDLIERDAIANTPHAPVETHDHGHEEMKTFIATPRTDSGVVERVMKWVKGETLKPGMYFAREKADGLRLMTIITSNSYEDREAETITSEAFKAYEASCFPGEGLFHCDNPLLWWHDDDIVMGEIIGVNYSEPFLLEVARELPNPVSKVLFDFAEQNGDKAGASHRFGYLEKDRDPDGTFHRIFKQETSYLPERALAANDKTYAGVVSMASPQSDALIDRIFEPIGIKNAAAKFHAKTGDIEKEFEALGLVHKALPPAAKQPPIPPKRAAADAQVLEADAAAQEGAMVEDEAMAEDMEEEAEAKTESTLGDLKRMALVMDSLFNMIQTIIEDSAASELDRFGMMKAYDELKEIRMSEKAAENATLDSLEAKLKALQEDYATTKARLADAEKALAMKPRSVTHEKGETAEGLKVTIDNVEKARKAGELQNVPGWGDLGPSIDYSAVTGK
jgi:hypothetical protein